MKRSEFLLQLAMEQKLAVVSNTGDISVEIISNRYDLGTFRDGLSQNSKDSLSVEVSKIFRQFLQYDFIISYMFSTTVHLFSCVLAQAVER